MIFCSNCNNMYYIKLLESEKKQLVYYCRKCGNQEDSVDENSVVVSVTNLKKSKQQYNHIINKYTKLDPTLPRVNNIDCPNADCICNKEGSGVKPEIIYIRYDNENMKYIYLCAHCDNIWQIENTN